MLIRKAKWGRGRLPREQLTDLVARGRKMPQIAAGWKVQYAQFAREGFTPALEAAVEEQGAHQVSLNELERTLIAAKG